MRLTQIIEALLFASDAPLSAADISRVDERLDEDTVDAVIQELRAEYDAGERSFQIYEIAGGYQLLTRPEFVSVLERYETVPQPSKLSAPALEVLAIIAYRQPLGRAEVEEIRGVGSSGVLRTLVERQLVEPVGRSEGLGRPLLYGTTRKFLEHFGFKSLEDLPRPDELPVVLRERPAPDAVEDADADTASGDAVAATTDAPPVADAGAAAGDTASGDVVSATPDAPSAAEQAEAAGAADDATSAEAAMDSSGDFVALADDAAEDDPADADAAAGDVPDEHPA